MRQVNFLKSEGGYCGFYALTMVINSLHGNTLNTTELVTKLKDVAHSELLTLFGEMYTSESILELLAKVDTGVEGIRVEFSTVDDLEAKLKDALNRGSLCFMAYYAYQGYPRIRSKKPDMKRGHLAVIYKVEDGRLWAKQSNSKADSLKFLDGVSVENFYKSNAILKDIPLRWYKYHKCGNMIMEKDKAFGGSKHSHCKFTQCQINVNVPSKYCCSVKESVSGCFIELFLKQ